MQIKRAEKTPAPEKKIQNSKNISKKPRRRPPRSPLESLLMRHLKYYEPGKKKKAVVHRVSDVPPIPRVTNVCTTAFFGCAINLRHLCDNCMNDDNKDLVESVIFEPIGKKKKKGKLSSSVQIKIQFRSENSTDQNDPTINRPMKATAIIYHTGKVVCVGTSNLADAAAAVLKVADVVKQAGFPEVEVFRYEVTNISSTVNVHFGIKMNLIEEHLKVGRTSKDVSHEPEIFPCIDYKPWFKENGKEVKVTAKIFHSGNVIITGAKALHHIYDTFNNLYPKLRKFACALQQR